LGFGWSHVEPWGVWSDAGSASLWLPQVPARAELVLRGRHFGLPGTRATIIWHLVGRGSATAFAVPRDEEFEWRVPLRPGDRLLEITLPSARSPAELALSQDSRVLGFGLSGIRLERRRRGTGVRRLVGLDPDRA
jgi:hypothetical protein